ncbi:MAG TPA: PilC/PilY family type IV pilus protein, partial [Candidatus Krumholzibacteria bacterium]|nr:PilC/PilY family type IV pilus protein [Candidatus Krumholzibacteria bacterium]
AGQLLSQLSPTSRTVFTYTGGVKRDFTATNASTLRTALGAADNTTATNIINWTRGQSVTGYRDRGGWPLGDIVDSSPVPVAGPNSFYLFNNYLAFRDANTNRQGVVYVGANDGMLHCFNATTGAEKWAYVPGGILPKLSSLASTSYCHDFYVNQSPRAADAYLNSAWRTVLIGGLKQGGNAYYSLDVTDPNSPTVLWENAIAEVGQSWATPEVTRLRTNNKFVAFVGSGYMPTGEAYLIGMDMETGTALWKTLLYKNAGLNIATSCSSVDRDFDGYDDVLYIADLTGRLWRVNLTGSSPTASLLFQTPANQAIQGQPIVTVDYNNREFVYFGTGRYIDATDVTTTYAQRFYCVVDDNTGSTVSISNLSDQTNAINIQGANNRGWYINLVQQTGERVTTPAALVNGVVYFTSFAPSTATCSGGGTSWLYAAKFRNGAAYDNDTNDANDKATGRTTAMGDGITARPVVDVINQKILVQGSDTRLHISDTQGQLRQMIVRSYRQRY